MAVAVKNLPDSKTYSGTVRLASASMMGALYVLAAVAVVIYGIPRLWELGMTPWVKPSLGSFINAAGLLVVELLAIGGLAIFGLTLAGPSAPAGLRGGVCTVFVGVVAAVLISVWIGAILENTLLAGESARPIGLVAMAAVFAGLMFWLWRLITRRSFPDKMTAFEAQGWFTAAPFKPNQGRRVRRVTMLGLLVLVGSGVYTLLQHQTLDAANKDWMLTIPFTADRFIKVLPDVKFTVPLVLAVAGLWLSYRVVNMPVFADFLVATEAEMNKVSWPTRKSLIQDTIVVLTTVVLMTVFLFVVDVGWGKMLSWVGVLKIEPTQAAPTKQLEEQEW